MYRCIRVKETRDCTNYRRISLLSIPGKLFDRALIERANELSRRLRAKWKMNRGGFRRGRGCVDQALGLREMCEKIPREWKRSVYGIYGPRESI